jgi:hypothetical protein
METTSRLTTTATREHDARNAPICCAFRRSIPDECTCRLTLVTDVIKEACRYDGFRELRTRVHLTRARFQRVVCSRMPRGGRVNILSAFPVSTEPVKAVVESSDDRFSRRILT